MIVPEFAEVMTDQQSLFESMMRMLHAGIQLYRAVEDADAALIPDDVRERAVAFRAIIEENA